MKNKKGTKNGLTKGAQTRQRILKAARCVFARHPYHAASIRMIAKEAGLEHGAIRYHFSRKSEMFEQTLQAVCDCIYKNDRKWIEETIGLEPEEGFSLYLDRVLEYYFNDPEPLYIINQNLSQVNKPEIIPGYHHLITLMARARETFRQAFQVEVDPKDLGRFADIFLTLIIHYVGASSLPAGTLGVEPESPEYLTWVKQTLMFIMVPVLEKMMRQKPAIL